MTEARTSAVREAAAWAVAIASAAPFVAGVSGAGPLRSVFDPAALPPGQGSLALGALLLAQGAWLAAGLALLRARSARDAAGAALALALLLSGSCDALRAAVLAGGGSGPLGAGAADLWTAGQLAFAVPLAVASALAFPPLGGARGLLAGAAAAALAVSALLLGGGTGVVRSPELVALGAVSAAGGLLIAAKPPVLGGLRRGAALSTLPLAVASLHMALAAPPLLAPHLGAAQALRGLSLLVLFAALGAEHGAALRDADGARVALRAERERREHQGDEVGRTHAELAREITTRREAERALASTEARRRESEDRSRALLDAIPDDILLVSRDGLCLDHRRAGEGPRWASANLARIRRLEEVLPADMAPRVAEAVASVCDGESARTIEGAAEEDARPRDLEARVARVGPDSALVIVRDISERKLADRLKNDFVSMVSHELRTPLTSIRGSLSLMASGQVADPESSRLLLDAAARNSERLVRLINDLLDLGKLEAGSLEFHTRTLDIVPLVGHAIEASRGYAEQLGVRLEAETDAPEAPVDADPDRIMQVLGNLLSNAARFSPRGETVRVRVARRGGAVRVSVSDRGPGIPEEFRPRVFRKFAQAAGGEAKGGTGLGLCISKSIVERHRGAMGFESEPGRGATFYFDLPVAG